MTTPSDHSRPFTYRLAIAIVRPLLMLFTKREWSGAENLPTRGWLRRLPQPLLATSSRSSSGTSSSTTGTRRATSARSRCSGRRSSGPSCGSADQIPVYRESGRAADAYRAAVAAVRAGKGVAIYPEGTLTRDPDLWPMRGKTGAARVALETQCPVIPVAHVGRAGGARALLQAAAPAARARRCRCAPGAPVRPRRPARPRAHRRGAARGDRPDHGGDHRRARGAARREGPASSASTRAPTASRPSASPAPWRRPHDERSGLRHGQLGHGVRLGARGCRHRRSRCGVAATRWSTRSTTGSTATTCPSCACRAPSARRPTRPRRPTAPTSSCSPCPRRRCAPTSPRGARRCRRSAAVVSLMKGVELGTTKRMSEVIAEVGGRRARAHRHRVRAEPGPRDRRQAAGGLGRGVGRATQMAELVAGGLRGALLPPLHGIRRRRHRDLRRGEERHRARRRHGRGPGDGRQLQGVDHHPRARRDDAARHGARRRRR